MKSLSLDDFYRQIPKADIHYHLLGGVRLNTMCDFAKKYNVALTEEDAKAYYRAYQQPGMKRKGGIDALTFLYQIMREPADYQRVILEVAEDAQQVGLRYIETFWNPSDTHLPYSELNKILVEAADTAEQLFGVIIRFIPSINREKTPEIAVDMVKTLIQYPHPYVLGIGIDYREENAPVEHFWKAYSLAMDHDLKLTAHCSEFGLHWRNVETGIELINCERIDHGYTIIDNPELTQKYAQLGIPFTVIPSNTYYLKQWPDKQQWRTQHPIREMAKAGLNIIPCTDDWHIHATNSANCYRVLVEEFGFDLDSLRAILANTIDACWVAQRQKDQWKNLWLSEFDQLRNKLVTEPSIKEDHRIRYRSIHA